jgi:hypothetical protein
VKVKASDRRKKKRVQKYLLKKNREHPPYMNIPEEEFLKEQNKYHKSLLLHLQKILSL